MTLADDPNTPEALQQRITKLEHDISEIRRAKATAAARAAHPDVWAVVLGPPEGAVEAFTGIPTGDPTWLRDRAEELASNPGDPTGRLLLTDGTAIDDTERAAAIAAMFPEDYPTETLDEVLPGTPTEEVLAIIGWPDLATVTDDEAAHDRDAIADERSDDTYAGARESLADALTAILSLAQTPGEDADLAAAEAELAAAQHALRTAVTAHLTGHVTAMFPDATSYTVGCAPDAVILLAVRTPTGRLYDFEDAGDDVHIFTAPAGVHLAGASIDVPAEWVNPFTGEQITSGTTVEVAR
ncbi:hypothetical protein ACWGJ9_08575 [Curtobacterium citreum]